MIDDTVINKSFAKVIENLSRVFCSKEGRSVLGFNIVVLAFCNGAITIPLAIKIWKKDGPSKYDLTLSLLSFARNILKIKPKYVVFDSWHSSKKILRRMQKYGWIFYTQIKRNRKMNGEQVRWRHKHPYWIESGTIDGDFHVLIARHGKKYFVTNDLTLCFMAFVVLERARMETNQTSYQLRRSFRFQPQLVDNLFIKLNFQGA